MFHKEERMTGQILYLFVWRLVKWSVFVGFLARFPMTYVLFYRENSGKWPKNTEKMSL